MNLEKKTIDELGYQVIQKFIDRKLLANIKKEINRILDKESEHSLVYLHRDRNNNVLVANQIDKESDFFFDICRHADIMSIAEELLGKPVVPLHVEYFEKPPHSSSKAPPHQDHAFYTHFPDEPALAFWVALDKVNTENGALEFADFVPKHLLAHKNTEEVHFDAELAQADAFSYNPILLNPGDCVAFHSFSIHRSGPNNTRGSRRAIVFNYRGSPYKAFYRM